MKHYIFLQSKGGVGKTEIAQSFAYYTMEKGKNALFIDADNSSQSLADYFTAVKKDAPQNIKFAKFNFESSIDKFDKDMFAEYLELLTTDKLKQLTKLENIDYTVTDFGAKSSEEFIEYVDATGGSDFINEMLEMNFVFFTIVGGGKYYTPCLRYFETYPQSLQEKTVIIGNDFHGHIEDVPLNFPKPAFRGINLENFKELSKNGDLLPEIIHQKKENKTGINSFHLMAIKTHLNNCNTFFDKMIALTNEPSKKAKK